MGKSIKLQDNTFWDSFGIIYKQESLKAILDKALFFKGVIPETNLNDFEETGIYYTNNLELSNIPVEASKMLFGVVIVIKCGKTNGITHQVIIHPWNEVFCIRQKSGSPSTWKTWKKIELKSINLT